MYAELHYIMYVVIMIVRATRISCKHVRGSTGVAKHFCEYYSDVTRLCMKCGATNYLFRVIPVDRRT